MALATFHSVRGDKSALIMVKSNPLEFGATPVYVPRDGVAHFAGMDIADIEKGHPFEIPDGYSLVDIMVTDEDDNVVPATTKDGVVLKKLQY